MSQRKSPNKIALGFGDLFADAGDHIGHFYETLDEWKELVVPFLGLGLEGNDKCVCVVSPGEAEDVVLAELERRGIDTAAALSSGQLHVTHGHGEPDLLKELLEGCLHEIPGRYAFLRWVGDMTWSHRKMPTSETLMRWESACNVVADAPVVFLCQYQLSQFMGSVVVDALKTHPLCVIRNAVHRNPFYEEPEAFLNQLRQRATTPLAPW